MAKVSTSTFIDGADLKQETIVQKGPAVPLNLSVTGSYKIGVESVSLDKASAEVPVGGTVKLTATVLPDNATDKTIVWSSSNENTATVDSNGVVTGRSSGTVTISAYTADGSKYATAAVTVVAAGD